MVFECFVGNRDLEYVDVRWDFQINPQTYNCTQFMGLQPCTLPHHYY